MSTSMRNLGTVAISVSSDAFRTYFRSKEFCLVCCSSQQPYLVPVAPRLRLPLSALRHRIGRAKLRLKRCQLGLDLLPRLALADDFFAIPPQEIINRFHANTDPPRGLVLVEVLEAEIRRPELLDNAFDSAIERRIVTAFVAGNLEGYQIRVPSRKLRRPHFVIGAATGTRTH